MINFEGEINTEQSLSNASSERDSIDKATPRSIDSGDDKKNRGNYRCSRCNLPKKGHVCPFQPIIRKRETAPQNFVDAEVQAEMDSDMTLISLGPLHLQGLPESYLMTCPKVQPHGISSMFDENITA